MEFEIDLFCVVPEGGTKTSVTVIVMIAMTLVTTVIYLLHLPNS